jgi:hypothetical protein
MGAQRIFELYAASNKSTRAHHCQAPDNDELELLMLT